MEVGRTADSAETLVLANGGGLIARRTVRYRCARFALRGVVDTPTAPWLAELLVQASVDPAVDVVAVDLAGVTFFGAAGLRCLNRAAGPVRERRARISVWDPPPFVRRVLEAGELHPSILVEPPDPR